MGKVCFLLCGGVILIQAGLLLALPMTARRVLSGGATTSLGLVRKCSDPLTLLMKPRRVTFFWWANERPAALPGAVHDRPNAI